jgi:hypothetical protein
MPRPTGLLVPIAIGQRRLSPLGNTHTVIHLHASILCNCWFPKHALANTCFHLRFTLARSSHLCSARIWNHSSEDIMIHRSFLPSAPSRAPMLLNQAPLQPSTIENGNVERRERKSVSFDAALTVSTNCSYIMEELDRGNIWYTPTEVFTVLEEQRRLANEIGRGSSQVGNSGECMRGLEDSLSDGAEIEVHFKIKSIIEAVLKEQEKQRSNGATDVEKLRKKAVKVSQYCTSRAVSLGKQDAREARRIQRPQKRCSSSKDDPEVRAHILDSTSEAEEICPPAQQP